MNDTVPDTSDPDAPAPRPSHSRFFWLALTLSILVHLLVMVRFEWSSRHEPLTPPAAMPVHLVEWPVAPKPSEPPPQPVEPPPPPPVAAEPPPAPPVAPPEPRGVRPKAKPHQADPPKPMTPGQKENRKKNEPQPLNLAPSLNDLTRWDHERTQRSREELFRAQEETVNLDTPKPRYTTYFARLKERVQQGWIYPAEAKRAGLSGTLSLRFTIERNGMITDIRVLNSSGVPILDEAALQAVRNLSPFLPLPEDWELERLHVKTIFEYVRGGFQWKR
ncbi:MAG: energy transducer TonB [Magnetococcales bacterium]|nr:energy transducer TonB [Magnetococcales bacterium]